MLELKNLIYRVIEDTNPANVLRREEVRKEVEHVCESWRIAFSTPEIARQTMERLDRDICETNSAFATLDLDPDDESTLDRYSSLTLAEIKQEAESARQIQESLKAGLLHPATLQLLLKHHAGKKKRGGRPADPHTDKAFDRWRFGGYSQKEAFKLYLLESHYEPIDATDYDLKWRSFKTALGERSRKQKK